MRATTLAIAVSLTLSGCSTLEFMVPQWVYSPSAIKARKLDAEMKAERSYDVAVARKPEPADTRPKIVFNAPAPQVIEVDARCTLLAETVQLAAVVRDSGGDAALLQAVHDYPINPILKEVYAHPERAPWVERAATLRHCERVGYVAARQELFKAQEDLMYAAIDEASQAAPSERLVLKTSYSFNSR